MSTALARARAAPGRSPVCRARRLVPLATWTAVGVALVAMAGSASARADGPPDAAVALPPASEARAVEAASEGVKAADPDEDPAERARRWFAEGNAHVLAGRHAAAARAFARSAEAVPTREAFYNEALAHELAGEPELALVAFAAYLAHDVDERGPPPDAAEVQARMARLEALVGWIVVRASGDAAFAEVRVDDAPLDPRLRTDELAADGARVTSLRVRAGLHRLDLVDAQGSSVARVVEVLGGQRAELDLATVETAADGASNSADRTTGVPLPSPTVGVDGGAPLDATAGSSTRRRQLNRDLAIASGAVTGTSLALTLTFAGLTLDAKRDFEAGLCEGACTNGERYPADDERRFDRSRTATNVLVGVTAGLAAVTVVLVTLAVREGVRGRGARSGGLAWTQGHRARVGARAPRRAGSAGPGRVELELRHGLRLRF